jgi:hypothetical protein
MIRPTLTDVIFVLRFARPFSSSSKRYVVNFPDSWSNVKKQDVLKTLQLDNIVDLSTRYVALETVLVNPATSTFSHVTVQFELSSSGKIIGSMDLGSGFLPALKCDMQFDWDDYSSWGLGIRYFFEDVPCDGVPACERTYAHYLKVKDIRDAKIKSSIAEAKSLSAAEKDDLSPGKIDLCKGKCNSVNETGGGGKRFRFGAGMPLFPEQFHGIMVLITIATYFILEECEEFLRTVRY